MAQPYSGSNNTASPSSSSSAADSYIGSFISVTSKCEIRYEGILYFLNPDDSTFGLKDVRSYGTEGRKKNGQQVPPRDTIYEYILFRGSDIKDLQVKTAPVQTEEPLYNDPAIIQSNCYMVPSSLSESVSATNGSSTEFNFYGEPPASTARTNQITMPSHHSGTESGIWGSSQLMPTAAPSYVMPAQWQEYSGAPGTTAAHPLQNQASAAMADRNLSDNVSSGHSFATSNSTSLTATPTLSFEPPSMSFTGPLSSKSSPPFHQSTLVNSNGLTMPFALTYQNASSIEAQVVNKVVPDPVSSQSVQSSTYFTSSVSDPITEPLLRKNQASPTPNLSQPTEHFLGKMLYPDQKDMGVTSSVAPNFASSAATASQPPLLPLPPPSRKLHDSYQFTEEFDFQAMNEKFNKDEVWGYLGKANQTDEVDGIQQNGTSNHKSWGDNPDRLSKTDSKPAYNKDDFFDNISCQTIGHGARNGQNQLPERVKLNSETFGNYQRRPPFGYGEHRGGRGEHRGLHNWGRGYYNYGNRGRGPYLQR
ncbi:hypothetical protein ACP275_01G047600 [Erythranthe tilingii]